MLHKPKTGASKSVVKIILVYYYVHQEKNV